LTTDTEKEDAMSKSTFFAALVAAGIIALAGGNFVGAADVEGININSASVEQLMQLRGIGSHHAAGIVEFREANGPFETPEDLMRVSGVGQKTFEKNKHLIRVEETGQTGLDPQ
jgi:competence protein ComEA